MNYKKLKYQNFLTEKEKIEELNFNEK